MMSTFFQSILATSLRNVDPYSPRLHSSSSTFSSSTSTTTMGKDPTSRVPPPRRKEGWTETFGSRNPTVSTRFDCPVDNTASATEEKGKGECTSDSWKEEEEYVQRSLQTSLTPFASDLPITLLQYRVAWMEQLVLRILRIPHVVLNSPHVSNESTGPLPCMIVTPTGETNENQNSNRTLVSLFMGRYDMYPYPYMRQDEDTKKNSMGFVSISGSSIVDFLLLSQNQKSPPLYAPSLFPTVSDEKDYPALTRSHSFPLSVNAEEYAIVYMIRNQLEPILLALRYGHMDTWEQIDRPQCISAYLDPYGMFQWDDKTRRRDTNTTTDGDRVHSHGPFYHDLLSFLHFPFHLFRFLQQGIARYQAWSERIVSWKHVLLSDPTLSTLFSSQGYRNQIVHVELVLEQAKVIYSLLNDKIQKEQESMIMTTQHPLQQQHQQPPTLLHVVLFAHLADALCNVHLVTLLAEYKYLIDFFQNMYQTYFGDAFHLDGSSMENPSPIKYTEETRTKQDSNRFQIPFSWMQWNQWVNSVNQFNHVPMNSTTHDVSSFSLFPSFFSRSRKNAPSRRTCTTNTTSTSTTPTPHTKTPNEIHAFHIMQSIAIHTHDLPTIVSNIAYQHKREEMLIRSSRVSNATQSSHSNKKHSPDGRMKHSTDTNSSQEECHSNKEETSTSTERDSIRRQQQQMEQLIRDTKKNDQLWVSSVLAVTLVGYFIAMRNHHARTE